jgi:predicted PurR-regulated permease PerM
LLEFIPIFGPALGFISFVGTGYAIGAESQVLGFPPLLYVFLELLNPIYWIEVTAYSTAIAESVWLYRRIRQKKYWELKNTAILIGICTALLVIGAIVESMLPLI